jgi:hypothetical protein
MTVDLFCILIATGFIVFSNSMCIKQYGKGVCEGVLITVPSLLGSTMAVNLFILFFCLVIPGLFGWFFFDFEKDNLLFYLTFGHYWPPKDTLLRKKLQEIVDEKMKLLAVDIRQHDEEEAAYQFKVRKGNIPYEEAIKELPKVRSIAKLYYGRFKRTQKIAENVGFKILDWREYEGLDKEQYPPADPNS